MGAWVVGNNMAGYPPHSDTYAFPTWDEAAEFFDAHVREYADDDDDGTTQLYLNDYYNTCNSDLLYLDYPDFENSGFGDDEPSMLATTESILADDGPKKGLPYTMTVADNDGYRIEFFIQWSDDRTPYDHEDGYND